MRALLLIALLALSACGSPLSDASARVERAMNDGRDLFRAGAVSPCQWGRLGELREKQFRPAFEAADVARSQKAADEIVALVHDWHLK